MKPPILFIDDESFFSRPYILELKERFEVINYKSAQSGLQGVTAHPNARLLILDIMMPSPAGVAATATNQGLETGIWLLDRIRSEVISRPLPVFVLTNAGHAKVKRALADVSIPARLIEIHAKIETPKFVLPSLVQALLDKV